MVEELKELVAQIDYMRAEDIRSWVRDHGQALVELVDRPDGVVISVELAKFLNGAAPLDEKWFGEPDRKGRSFWWRGDIQQAIDLARTKASAGEAE